MANVPIAPALKREIKEIIVVLLSPAATYRQPMPQTHLQVCHLIFEQFLIGSYHSSLSYPAYRDAEIKIIAPAHTIGFLSVLNFSSKQAEALIREGYEQAKASWAI